MRYPALLTIASVFKVLAWIVGILGFLMAVVGAVTADGGAEAVVYFIVAVLGTVFYCLMFYASAEAIKVIIDIESNTRESARSILKRNLLDS